MNNDRSRCVQDEELEEYGLVDDCPVFPELWDYVLYATLPPHIDTEIWVKPCKGTAVSYIGLSMKAGFRIPFM